MGFMGVRAKQVQRPRDSHSDVLENRPGRPPGAASGESHLVTPRANSTRPNSTVIAKSPSSVSEPPQAPGSAAGTPLHGKCPGYGRITTGERQEHQGSMYGPTQRRNEVPPSPQRLATSIQSHHQLTQHKFMPTIPVPVAHPPRPRFTRRPALPSDMLTNPQILHRKGFP
jgi:hypothetical protein